MISQDRLAELFSAFSTEFVQTDVGARHFAKYVSGRDAGRRNFAEVQAAAATGIDVTDLVLLKLLPHMDTAHNRNRGAWCHVAPAVTKDIRTWFENVGWTKPEDWPVIAQHIFIFVTAVNNNPGSLSEACDEIAAETKGVQSAFLSPILNALNPAAFVIVNSKTLKTLKAVWGLQFKAKITSYPRSNAAALELVKAHRDQLAGIRPDATPGDVLDAFCHWYIALRDKKRKRTETQIETEKDDEEFAVDSVDRESPEFAREWWKRTFPDPQHRTILMRAVVDAITCVHPHGPARWSVTLMRRSLRLNVGRLRGLRLRKVGIEFGIVPASLPPDLAAELDSVGRWKGEYDTQPSTKLLELTVNHFVELYPRMHGHFAEFLGTAAGTARRTPYFRSHSPGVIVALQENAPDIPAPAYGDERDSPPPPPPHAIALTGPRALFSKVDYELSHLLSGVDTGEIGLPDLQRPFVWSAAKVRDLFDSMYRGFPVGYLLFWSNSELQNAKAIGVDAKQKRVPRLVIVDGQQRLTSLYAVLRGKSVLDDEFLPTKIEIAFRPRDGLFEVTDAAIRRDAEYIPSISDVWAPGSTSWTVVNRFFAQLEARRELTAEDKEAMSRNLDRLFDLQRYSFTSLEIMADVSEAAIADIFVRINSQGVKLNQADFLLTLLSVFWQEGRAALETFSRQSTVPPVAAGKPSAFNYIIQPSPDQILRVAVATGFHRARLRSVYQVLRGKDVESGLFSEAKRDEQFGRLRAAQENVLNLNYWHDYLSCLRHAGYRGGEMISSENAVIYGYAVYLLGRLQCEVPLHQLMRLIQRWFVMSSVTARYSGSAESIMEEDLGRFKPADSPTQFADVMDATIKRVLTPDFWTISLPADLESSSSRAPAFLAFLAAQCALGAPVLFSDKKVRDVLDPALRPGKKAIDRHHLFPKGWLQKQGISDNKFQNQVANLSYVEWPENIAIKNTSPKDYVPKFRERFSDHAWTLMYQHHGLFDGWEALTYDQFLRERRQAMASIIRKWFAQLEELSPDGARLEDGKVDEREVWHSIEQIERQLRKVIRDRYQQQWGSRADNTIRSVLGDQAMATIDKNRDKYEAQYPSSQKPATDPILDFCYLGQLVQLMVAGPAWQLYKAAFEDKRQLEDFARAIIPVRNDGAHFRSVPSMELQRCRIAVSDLAHRLQRLDSLS